MSAKDITNQFLKAIGLSRSPHDTLAINLSPDPAFDIANATEILEESDWQSKLTPNKKYSFITVDLPLAGQREEIVIGQTTLVVRSNWTQLVRALRLLSSNGMCVAVLEPVAFGTAIGAEFEKALASEGFYLAGIFRAPPNLLKTTKICPVIAIFSREQREELFVAELQSADQSTSVAQSFIQGSWGNTLLEGMQIPHGAFSGFDKLRAQLQLQRLETQYKDYQTYALADIAVSINTVSSDATFEHIENSIYIPKLGSSHATHELSGVTVKHHNVIQVVLTSEVRSDYVAAFFRSDLGLLILRWIASGSYIPGIAKANLQEVQIAVPDLPEQAEIVSSHNRLQVLTDSISEFQRELALNPRSASSIGEKIDEMLETIGTLSGADKVLKYAREGESATVEFKQSLGLDIKTGKKETYIENSSLKTIVAFLNSRGGILLIGVTDAGDIAGVDAEVKKFHKDEDAFLLHFKNRLKARIGEQYYPCIDQRLISVGDHQVLMVDCKPSDSPCYLDQKEFYVRTNPATDKLEGPKLVEYVKTRFADRL